jgi:sec-independent protein translocase protein TatA
MLAGWEWAVVLAIVVIVAGGKKLPELGSGLGKGISEFKKAIGGDKPEEDQKQIKEGEAKSGDAKPGETK